MIMSQSIYIAYSIISLFFMVEEYSIVCVYPSSLPIPLLVDI